MVSHPPSSSDRHSNSRSGAGIAHGKPEKTPGTPRREGGVVKDRAVQDPVLRDYVGLPFQLVGTVLLILGIDSWRMFGERSVWFGLQSLQLGNWRSGGCEADQIG